MVFKETVLHSNDSDLSRRKHQVRSRSDGVVAEVEGEILKM